MEGTVIGTYRVLRKLGEGGMGAVYLAEHSLLGRKAAVKVLQPELSRNQDIVQRFFNEARAATAIADPGIVQIFDFGYHTDGSAYIVMEFLEGEPLDGRVKRLGRLAPIDALRILRQVASSLASAHARGIVHRDLKPENIFLVADREVAYGERPKLLDFGIAKLTLDTESKVKTATSAIMGTPMYMSPEQCRGAGYVDQRSDLYSLGCVLYHLLVGRPPFDGEGVGDIIACHLRSPAPAPSAAVPGIPPEVDALTLRLMAKSPAERFGSAVELADAIGIMIGASLPPPPMMMPSGGYPIASAHPTTLSGSAGHLHVSAAPSMPGSIAPRRRRGGLIAGVIAGVALATTAVVVVVATGGGGGKTAAAGGADEPKAGPSEAAPPPPAPAVTAAPTVSPVPAAIPAPMAQPPIAVGASVWATKGCSGCHTVDGSTSVGPTWRGSWGQTITLGDGRRVTVDAAYVKRAIEEPHAEGRAGFQVGVEPRIPLSAAELDGVVAYIESLSSPPSAPPPPASTAAATTGSSRPPHRGSSRDKPPATTTPATTAAPPPAVTVTPPAPPPVTPPPPARVPCDRDGDGIPDDRC